MADETQLRLEPDAGAAAPFPLTVPERLVKLVRRLEPAARMDFALRAPHALQQLVDGIISRGQIPDDELRQRLAHAEREAAELRAEQEIRARRRRTCQSCQEIDGHLPGCEAA